IVGKGNTNREKRSTPRQASPNPRLPHRRCVPGPPPRRRFGIVSSHPKWVPTRATTGLLLLSFPPPISPIPKQKGGFPERGRANRRIERPVRLRCLLRNW